MDNAELSGCLFDKDSGELIRRGKGEGRPASGLAGIAMKGYMKGTVLGYRGLPPFPRHAETSQAWEIRWDLLMAAATRRRIGQGFSGRAYRAAATEARTEKSITRSKQGQREESASSVRHIWRKKIEKYGMVIEYAPTAHRFRQVFGDRVPP